MSSRSRLVGSLVAVVGMLALAVAAPVGAQDGDPVPSDPTAATDPTVAATDASADPSTSDSTSTTTTTTTTALPLPPAENAAPAQRAAEPIQVTETQPPPPTTAALPPGPAGFDTEELPPDSGTGRRAVYSKGQMRVWIVEEDGTITRTYRVSGRMSQPNPGTYAVFSRSPFTCAMKRPDICMRWMVRFTRTVGGGDNIGFHEIPRQNGTVPLQSDAQLGQALSGGCVRQSTSDALFMWEWAQLGTKVVVTP